MTEDLMNSVWKVASRWSETGHAESSILDIFRRHNVVFVGKSQDRFRQIAEGDLIVISDAKTVVAMGLATTPPQPVTDLGIEFTEDDLRRFDFDDYVFGCRVSFTDLSVDNQPHYRPSTFHAVVERADEFRRIYRGLHRRFEEEQQFEIKARSCTLARNTASPMDVLWQDSLLFRVPIYQRPYSWKAAEIRRFVGDLLSSFRGANGRPVQEPMFIGTMQLTDKKAINDHGWQYAQEVIDGQQRLSTLMLLLKVLKDRSPDSQVWAKLDIHSRLETRVSSGEQQKYLNEALSVDSLKTFDAAQNPYLEVIPLILSLLEDVGSEGDEPIGGSDEVTGPLDRQGFVSYLTSRVYFVVIETRATLSKTLQIFDAINSSGMDLNGGDLFKVKYYDYLKRRHGVAETEFEKISALYRDIDEKNREAGRKVCTIEGILSLAQHLTVTRHEMAKVLHDYSAAVFFERFFDTVLRVNAWPNYSLKECQKIEVGLEELKRLIEVSFEWDKQIRTLGVEARCLLEFIWWSRYGKYYYLVILFRDRFGPEQGQTERFVIQFSKLLILFSIEFWRTVNELHSIMHDLQERIFGKKSATVVDEVIAFLRQATVSRRQRITVALSEYELAHNPKAKGLACRLSALLHEMEQAGRTAEEFRAVIFDTPIDIEHIESVNHKGEAERQRIQTAWGRELNRIGNLMVLDSSLNRSISNEDYKTVKWPAYAEQKLFRIVRRHAEQYPDWHLKACEERKNAEVRRLVEYICE
jgi:hypothetical protein